MLTVKPTNHIYKINAHENPETPKILPTSDLYFMLEVNLCFISAKTKIKANFNSISVVLISNSITKSTRIGHMLNRNPFSFWKHDQREKKHWTGCPATASNSTHPIRIFPGSSGIFGVGLTQHKLQAQNRRKKPDVHRTLHAHEGSANWRQNSCPEVHTFLREIEGSLKKRAENRHHLLLFASWKSFPLKFCSYLISEETNVQRTKCHLAFRWLRFAVGCALTS